MSYKNIYLRFDETIMEDEKEIFEEAVKEFNELFGNKVNFKFYDKDEKSLLFIRLMKKKLLTDRDYGYGRQLNMDLFYSLTPDPFLNGLNQEEQKIARVFIIDMDFFIEKSNFLVGLRIRRDEPIIISVVRFRKLKGEEKRRALKALFFHEIGHLFNAPSGGGRDDLVYIFGWHDPPERICVMRQGLNVPDDWIKFGNDMVEHGKIYCEYCEKAIKKEIKKLNRSPKNK